MTASSWRRSSSGKLSASQFLAQTLTELQQKNKSPTTVNKLPLILA